MQMQLLPTLYWLGHDGNAVSDSELGRMFHLSGEHHMFSIEMICLPADEARCTCYQKQPQVSLPRDWRNIRTT